MSTKKTKTKKRATKKMPTLEPIVRTEEEPGQENNGSVDEYPGERSSENKQEDRQREWGQQFHKWLIGAARKNKTVNLCLADPGYFGSTVLEGIPKRVDRDFLQMIVAEEVEKEVWIQLKYILSCEFINPVAEGTAE